MNYTINWQQAKEINQEQNVKKANLIQEYKEMNHSMTDARDLLYFQEGTGKDLAWLLENGTGLSSLLIQLINAGATLDDLWHIDPTKNT